jgi:Secretion system C-terminal sorting domain
MRKLLKKCLLSSLFILGLLPVNAQVNLLRDGSFEDTTAVWQDYTGKGCLTKWSGLDSNDNRHGWALMSYLRIKDVGSLKLPKNGHVSQDAYSSNNIIWLTSWCPTCATGPLGRSVMRAKLRQQLTAGKQYCLVAHAVAFDFNGSHYTNGLGVYLDDGGLDTMVTKHNDFTGTYDFVTPQFQAPTVITDTIEWTVFRSTITATGTETFFTIGNFQSDSGTLKVAYYNGTCPACNDYGIDAFSLIPLDLNNWLHDTFTTVGDSVWVGLDKYDYFEGQWYNTSMQKISKAPGFWFTPTTSAPTMFIHEVDVCGAMKKDTCYVYVYPSLIENGAVKSEGAMRVWPNPSNGVFTVEVNNKLIGTPLQIINVAGKLVYTCTAAKKTEVDLSGLPKGIYTIRAGGVVSKILLSHDE